MDRNSLAWWGCGSTVFVLVVSTISASSGNPCCCHAETTLLIHSQVLSWATVINMLRNADIDNKLHLGYIQYGNDYVEVKDRLCHSLGTYMWTYTRSKIITWWVVQEVEEINDDQRMAARANWRRQGHDCDPEEDQVNDQVYMHLRGSYIEQPNDGLVWRRITWSALLSWCIHCMLLLENNMDRRICVWFYKTDIRLLHHSCDLQARRNYVHVIIR